MFFDDSDSDIRKKLIEYFLKDDLSESEYLDIVGYIIHYFLIDNGCSVDPVTGSYLLPGL